MLSFSTVSLRSRAGLLAVSAGALMWGTTGVAVDIVHARTGLDAVTIGWFRVLIAALVVGVGYGRRGVRRAAAALRRHPVALTVAGAGFGGYQALYFIGVQEVGVSVATLVSLGVAPVALTIGAAVARRRRPSPGSLAVVLTALVGLALVSLRPDAGDAPHPLLGVLVSVLSGLGYAAITAITSRLPHEEPLLLTGITSGVGTVVLLPFALVAGISWPHDAIASWWLVYIGLVPTVLAYVLFYRGLRTTAYEVAGVLTLLEPLLAAVLAAIVVHESLTVPAIIGSILLLAAVASLYVRRRPAEP